MNEQEELDKMLPPGLLALLNGPILDLRAPMDKVCPCCGAKHTGPFQNCSSCKTALDRGE